LVLALALPVAACSGQTETESARLTETTASTAAIGGSPSAAPVSEDAEPVSALSLRRKADAAAEEWKGDAKLYAIAAAAPVNAKGLSRAWSYTYVSRSVGTVSSVTVSGGEASRNPAQQLPEQDVKDVSDHTIPANGEIIDSTKAMENSDKVGAFLEKRPAARASMGLDSFSSERPSWILTVSQERMQEKIPATQGS
jgi:hypothetical protein